MSRNSRSRVLGTGRPTSMKRTAGEVPPELSMCLRASFGQLINDRLERGRWDRFALRLGRFQPGRLGFQNFRESLFRTLAECCAVGKIRNIGNVSAVFLTVKNVDVVVFHFSLPRDRLYSSTSASNCLTW